MSNFPTLGGPPGANFKLSKGSVKVYAGLGPYYPPHTCTRIPNPRFHRIHDIHSDGVCARSQPRTTSSSLLSRSTRSRAVALSRACLHARPASVGRLTARLSPVRLDQCESHIRGASSDRKALLFNWGIAHPRPTALYPLMDDAPAARTTEKSAKTRQDSQRRARRNRHAPHSTSHVGYLSTQAPPDAQRSGVTIINLAAEPRPGQTRETVDSLV